MEIELKLTLDQVNAIMFALSEQPIKTGFGNLIAEISRQVEPQLPAQPQETTEE